ncbi:MAG: hypothetical protein ACI4O7_01860 [Aristaeellaceae bacterium]
MLTPLRRNVQTLLADVPVCRKPALRRSDAPEALLATDLPLAAEDAAVEAFLAAAEDAGWTVIPRGEWLLLDHPVDAPDCPMPERLAGEAGCCLSLLVRHGGDGAPREDIRALVKARDAGGRAVERLCAAWHREWAARLRRREPLPGGLIPYLCRAMTPAAKEDAP